MIRFWQIDVIAKVRYCVRFASVIAATCSGFIVDNKMDNKVDSNSGQ
jgi:hypothetical protein